LPGRHPPVQPRRRGSPRVSSRRNASLVVALGVASLAATSLAAMVATGELPVESFDYPVSGPVDPPVPNVGRAGVFHRRAARRPWSGTRRDPRPGPCWPPRPWPGRSCPARRTRTASWVAGRPARPSPPGRGTGSAGSGPAPPTSRQALAGRGPASLGRRPAPPGRGRAPDRPGPATGYRSGPAPRSEVPVDSGGGPQPPSHRQKGWPTGSK
jgi:hypothetical protein